MRWRVNDGQLAQISEKSEKDGADKHTYQHCHRASQPAPSQPFQSEEDQPDKDCIQCSNNSTPYPVSMTTIVRSGGVAACQFIARLAVGAAHSPSMTEGFRCVQAALSPPGDALTEQQPRHHHRPPQAGLGRSLRLRPPMTKRCDKQHSMARRIWIVAAGRLAIVIGSDSRRSCGRAIVCTSMDSAVNARNTARS